MTHELVPGFQPDSALERRLVSDGELAAGLAWGLPRPGHPEGSVGHHVAAILEAIPDDDPLRAELRVLALVHDSFKRAVRLDRPWSPDNDHAVLARRFAVRFIRDERMLVTLELHDEPYWLWRTHVEADALDGVLGRIPDLELFVRFVELDASCEGKDPAFVQWFCGEVARRALYPADTSATPASAAATPVACHGESRSPSTARASTTVTTG